MCPHSIRMAGRSASRWKRKARCVLPLTAMPVCSRRSRSSRTICMAPCSCCWLLSLGPGSTPTSIMLGSRWRSSRGRLSTDGVVALTVALVPVHVQLQRKHAGTAQQRGAGS